MTPVAKQQNFKNHGRVVPSYHIGVLGAFTAYLIWAIYRLFQTPEVETAIHVLVSSALLTMGISLRGQILRVQDRVIRLEMRLRMRDQLPTDVASRAAHLPVKQLIALRFASDQELGQLVREVLEGSVTDPKEIKKRITDWQADHLRA